MLKNYVKKKHEHTYSAVQHNRKIIFSKSLLILSTFKFNTYKYSIMNFKLRDLRSRL